MALFKIEKGMAANLLTNRPNAVEGYCYFTTDDGKFYIDTESGPLTGANPTGTRIALNAEQASKLLFGDVSTASGTSLKLATIDGLTSFSHGDLIVLKNNQQETDANASININNLGVRPIYANGSPIEEGVWKPNGIGIFFFDSTLAVNPTYNTSGAWVLMSGAGSVGDGVPTGTKENSVFYVTGGGETAGDWIGTHVDITQEDLNNEAQNLKIIYTIGISGSDSAVVRGGLNDGGYRNYTSLNLGFGYKPVYRSYNPSTNKGIPLTTEYKTGESILLTYHYLLDEGFNDISYWLCLADYDTNDPNTQTQAKYNNPFIGNTILPYTLCARNSNNMLCSLVTTAQPNDWDPLVKTPYNKGFYPGTICFYNHNVTLRVEDDIPNIPENTLCLEDGEWTKAIYTFSSRLKINRTIFIKGIYDETTGLFTITTGYNGKWYAQMPSAEDIGNFLTSFDVEGDTSLNYNFETGFYYIPICETGNEAYTEAHQSQDNFRADNPKTTYKAHLFKDHPVYFCDGTGLLLVSNIAQRMVQGTVGNATRPIYLEDGIPTQIDYTIQSNVPLNANFANTVNTTGVADNSANKLYIVGSTTQSGGSAITNTSNSVFMQNGDLHATKLTLNNAITLQYNASDECLDFIFK